MFIARGPSATGPRARPTGTGGLRGPATALSIAMVALVAAVARADESAREGQDLCQRGPLRIRNQFPLNLHHLGFPGEDASVVEARRFTVSVDFTAANIFAATEDMKRLHEGGPRRRLTREELDALVASNPARDQFLFDAGVGRLGLVARYGVTDRVELGLEVPYISLGGGILDGLIEGFHDTFHLSQSGRTGYPRDELQIALHLGDKTVFYDGRDATRGLGDPVVSAKLRLTREARLRPEVAVRLAVKPSIREQGSLLGSGGTDAGLDLLLAKHLRRQSVYANVAYVWDGGWWLLPDAPRSNVGSVLIAYEVWLSSRASFVVQNLTHTSFLAQATDSDLAALSHELSLGVKFDTRGHLGWALSLTENYATFKSSPDFGLHAGVVCAF